VLVSTFGMVLTFLAIRRFREIANALDNFEQYDADFKKKWGP
jgi:hypothetical protein